MKWLLAALAVAVIPAAADDLTLNDIPRVLSALKDCAETKGIFTKSIVCNETGTWIGVDDKGRVTIFYHSHNHDDLALTGAGSNLNEAVNVLAKKLNERRGEDGHAIDKLAPFLPTQ